MVRKIALVTSCGKKKEDHAAKAYNLYKSPSIRAVYNRRSQSDMFILSAEHALLPSEKITVPYNRLMDASRAAELAPLVAKELKSYDMVVFFKADANIYHLNCMVKAFKLTGFPMIAFGYGFIIDLLGCFLEYNFVT